MMPKITIRSYFWALFNALAMASSFAGVIFIIAARGHYLIDVLIAYFITTTVFYIYHTLVYNKSLRSNQKNYLTRFWWYHLLKYLEYDHIICSTSRATGICPRCDSYDGEVPRKFDWPFSWPSFHDRRSTSLQRLLSQTT